MPCSTHPPYQFDTFVGDLNIKPKSLIITSQSPLATQADMVGIICPENQSRFHHCHGQDIEMLELNTKGRCFLEFAYMGTDQLPNNSQNG